MREFSAPAVRKDHFGLTVGSPPGEPGVGMMRVVPTSGAGFASPGSTSAGGGRTPFERSNLSLRLSLCSPEPVVPFSCGSIFSGIVVFGLRGALSQ